MPTVSIIVPVYRTERYLQECLASIAAQTFLDWECIIVDDGSDQPRLIDAVVMKSLGEKSTIIHQNNQGLPAARNRGMARARGCYLLCLDSDDLLHPQYLEKAMVALETTGAGIAFCLTQHIGCRSDVARPQKPELFSLLRRNLISVTSLFRKDVVDSVGGFDESFKIGHEDWEFWIRVCRAGYHFVCVPEPLFYYRIMPGSMNTAAARRRDETIAAIRNKHRDIYYQSLKNLLAFEPFKSVPKHSLAWFRLTNMFFQYVPAPLRKALFGLYRLGKDG
jgi:glycosyltransferase involved in cell wall biosynthesis